MKKFDQLTPYQKRDVLDRAFLNAARQLYQGGLDVSQQIRSELDALVKEVTKSYFDDSSNGSFCGCATCLMYLVKEIKATKYGQVKETIAFEAQKMVERQMFLESGDDYEVL